jgi:hypothetical protein
MLVMSMSLTGRRAVCCAVQGRLAAAGAFIAANHKGYFYVPEWAARMGPWIADLYERTDWPAIHRTVARVRGVLHDVCAAQPGAFSPALQWLVDHGLSWDDLLARGGLYNVLTAAEDVTRAVHDVDPPAVREEAGRRYSEIYKDPAHAPPKACSPPPSHGPIQSAPMSNPPHDV